MLWRGLKTACYHGLMHIDHYLKDVDQCQSHNRVWCRFICTVARTVAAFLGGFDFFFRVCEGVTNPRDPQVHRALFGVLGGHEKVLLFRQHPLGLYVEAHAACGPQGCSTSHSEKFSHI